MDGRSLPSKGKRVRFSYDEPDPDEGHKDKKPRFPKGKKESQRAERNLDVVFEGEEGDGPIKSTDPRVAATERAGRRILTLDHLEETSLPPDVYGAEEEYQDSDGGEEEDGISIEPFNLKQEREEGYFDADGNYVEYRNDNDVKDAWLDTAEVDTTLAAKHMKRYAEEEVELELSSKELAAIKRRIADALQPGETVLRALRRLKSLSTEKDRHSKAKMSSHTKETFDMLTEDAMKLLDNGEYNVYHEEKETFQREAEGYESLEKAKLHSFSLRPSGETSTSEDMFGSDVDNSSVSEAEQYNGTARETRFTNNTVGNIGNMPPRNSTQDSMDMFADDDNEAARNSDNNQGEDSGYVYDDTSGYYYNSSLGYYYDGNSGLFCNAASGKWFRFDEESNSYSEVVESQAEH